MVLLSKLRRNVKLLTSFATGQLASQFLQVLTGFLVIRWMTKEDFGQFTLAFAVQNTFGMLVEMGLSSAFLAFIGDKHTDPVQVSRYFNAVWYWRKKLFLVIAPLSLVAFILLTYDKNWTLLTQALLFLSIPLAIYYQGFSSFYSVVLRIKSEIGAVYKIQVGAAIFRLVIVLALYGVSWLSGWIYLWLNAATIVLTGLALAPLANRYRDLRTEADPESRKQVLQYIKPSMLGISFSAIQSQMTVILISIFGKTSSIADIGALGRLGQLFTFLNAFNGMILQPWFAKMSIGKVLKNTLFVVGTIGIGLGVFTVFSFYYPQVFQWILGKQYDNLAKEFGYSVLIACIGYISAIFLLISGTKKWVYWWSNILYIILFFLINTLGIVFLDLSTVMGIIKLSLIFSISFLLQQVARFLYGIKFSSNI
ncbi:MAG: oligosaccharide flippase family protein [Algoriphagus sp.]|uniref:lipopolysaccharide biosynthesis protein n=1 Tax=Algoriphagus sp. TaxID=1872435 RepID=UPI0018149BD9|nr:hypothetical protein [Algoriphagus sp.]NVJ86003.1 oligosaccharide flippase family protein [Algoriphagus sp.]